MSLARAYFRSLDTNGNGQLWVTDGTAAGTAPVPAPGGGPSGFYPQAFARLGDALYVQGNNGRFGLFRIDPGTNAVTELVAPGAGSVFGLSPQSLTVVNGGLYFSGFDSAGNVTLWRSDGTAPGTAEVAIPGLANTSYYPAELTAFGGQLAFAASPDPADTSLYVTGPAGTIRLQVQGASSYGLAPSSMAALGGLLVISGSNAAQRRGLWVSDGTGAGTTPLAVPGLAPNGDYNGRPAGLLAFGGDRAAFTAYDAAGRSGVWVTDGTVAGTIGLPGVYGAPNGAPMAAMAGNRLAFIATDAGGTAGVYVSDGTAAGTAQVAVAGVTPGTLAPHALFTLGNQLLFDGTAADGGRALFGWDGPAPATVVKAGVNLVAGTADADAGTVGGSVGWTDAVTHASGTALSDLYTGPVSTLQQQYIWAGNDAVAIRADGPSTFLKGGPGGDALQVTGGNNVLDGGGGSNFLIGASGHDTFFVDGRGGVETWSTIVNFHAGDQATIFGFHAGISTRPYTANDGAVGYKGLTIHSEIDGAGTGIKGSMTFSGLDQATADAHWSITTGTLLAGTAGAVDYLLVQWDH